eukprot:SAG31_NODE_2940_length_4882_cov_7.133807_1_plen_169_part_00
MKGLRASREAGPVSEVQKSVPYFRHVRDDEGAGRRGGAYVLGAVTAPGTPIAAAQSPKQPIRGGTEVAARRQTRHQGPQHELADTTLDRSWDGQLRVRARSSCLFLCLTASATLRRAAQPYDRVRVPLAAKHQGPLRAHMDPRWLPDPWQQAAAVERRRRRRTGAFAQ